MTNWCPLGQLADTEVGVQPTLDSQDILIQHSAVGQRLRSTAAVSVACLLAPVAAEQ